MIQLITLLLCLCIVSYVAHALWKAGRRLLVASAFFVLAGLVFPNPVAGLALIVAGVACLFFF